MFCKCHSRSFTGEAKGREVAVINGLKTVSEVDEDEDGDHDLIMLLMNDGGDHCYENEEDGDDDEVDFMLVQL